MKKSSYGKCHLSNIPVRGEASHRAEMVTQLLYNEYYTIIEQNEEWTKIYCQHDNYEGWIAANQVYFIDLKEYNTPPLAYQSELFAYNPKIAQTLFVGTPLFVKKEAPIHKKEKLLLNTALQFINTPYLWGGRSPLGIDCSGLMQILFRIIGYSLPRDAYQQAEIGQKVEWGEHQLGDLAFFKNKKGKITHVGLIVDTEKIIHASAWVRQDLLTKEGIWHQKKQTHQLSHIQRLPKK